MSFDTEAKYFLDQKTRGNRNFVIKKSSFSDFLYSPKLQIGRPRKDFHPFDNSAFNKLVETPKRSHLNIIYASTVPPQNHRTASTDPSTAKSTPQTKMDSSLKRTTSNSFFSAGKIEDKTQTPTSVSRGQEGKSTSSFGFEKRSFSQTKMKTSSKVRVSQKRIEVDSPISPGYTAKTASPNISGFKSGFQVKKLSKKKATYKKYLGYERLFSREEGGMKYKDQLRQHLHQSFKVLKMMHRDSPENSVETKEREDSEEARKEKILALDLDETLVHCCNFDPAEQQKDFDKEFEYRDDRGMLIRVRMNLRPFLTEFLSSVSSLFKLVVFTSADLFYANAVVDLIDPGRCFIKEIYHRNHCSKTKKGLNYKDLSIISGYQDSQVFLLDNSTQNFVSHLDFGIPILSFTYDRTDCQLKEIIPFLRELARQANPQEFIKNYFKLHLFPRFGGFEELLDHLSK